MTRFTVGTTPVQIDPGTASSLLIVNNSTTGTVLVGPGGHPLRPGRSAAVLRDSGVATFAVTESDTVTIDVTVTGTYPGATVVPAANPSYPSENLIGTAAQWTAHDLVLDRGQEGIQTGTPGTELVKIGDGVTRFSQLPSAAGGGGGYLTQAAASGTYARIQQGRGGGFYGVKQDIAAGRNVHVAVLGDSTGDETTEWVYLLAAAIGTANPAYNVEYRLWNDTPQKYGPLIRIQAGTAGRSSVTAPATGYPQYYPAARTNTADLDVAVRMKPVGAWNTTPSGSGNASFAAQVGTSGNRVWDFWVSSGGSFAASVFPDGINAQQFTATAGPTLTSGTEGWLRVTIQGNDGSGNSVGKFYQSTDGSTWTQLGSTVTKTGTTTSLPAAAATQYMEAGGRNGGQPWTGATLYEVAVRDGIDGPVINAPNVAEWIQPAGTTAVVNGGPTLTVWNGSRAGANVAYLGDATRLPKLLPQVPLVAVMVNDAHNETYIHGVPWRTLYNTLVTSVRSRSPFASLILFTQNPQTAPSPNAQHERRCIEINDFGPALNAFVVDTYAAFLADPRGLAVLIAADGIHPSLPDGRNLWATTAIAAYTAA